VRAEFDSPIDALVHLHVPADEAADVVKASWHADGAVDCHIATVDGGRQVAAIRTPEGRWAACMVLPGAPCATRAEAERRAEKLAKRGWGLVAGIRNQMSGIRSISGGVAAGEEQQNTDRFSSDS
ncbi:MAG: hypothetical protein LBM17_00395, partial [Candidatus Accumulibacter sp.]|nr:hypothetical protein [Accumulibacter sp.]